MPTVRREHGFNFVIYVDDHPPAHVHVTGKGSAKIDLQPVVSVAYERGMSKADVRRTLGVVKARREEMMVAWKQIHG